MPDCGSQVTLCGLPIRFDTYSGCSHLCRYCFAQRKVDLESIRVNETEKALLSFVKGNRTNTTNWCDWDIPLHWGGLSDPFQPIEKKHRVSLKCLKVLAETKYPFVVSTKGKLVVAPEYLDLLKECNCVVQISAVCSKYDILEPGAPTYEERLKMASILSKVVPRVVIRMQPYMADALKDIIANIPRLRAAGVYGIIVEGMKFLKRKPGLVKVGSDFVYPVELLRDHYSYIKDTAHANGLKFYCGENRLRGMGDDLICCGIDGLPGFRGNMFNLCHMHNGVKAEPTEQMQKLHTAVCFRALEQTSATDKELKESSFYSYMLKYYARRKAYFKTLFSK